MSVLNKEAYEIKQDDLIYDGSQPIDGAAVTVTFGSAAAADGVIKKGQVLDVAAGVYSLHAASGAVSVVVAEDTEYAEGDATVVCAVYTSGALRKSKIVTDVALVAADIETFRGKGIFLK